MKSEQPEKAVPSPAVAAAVDGIYRAARAAIARPLWRGDLEADWSVLEPPPPPRRPEPELGAPRAITGGSFGLAPRPHRAAAPASRGAAAAPDARGPADGELAVDVDLTDLT